MKIVLITKKQNGRTQTREYMTLEMQIQNMKEIENENKEPRKEDSSIITASIYSCLSEAFSIQISGYYAGDNKKIRVFEMR